MENGSYHAQSSPASSQKRTIFSNISRTLKVVYSTPIDTLHDTTLDFSPYFSDKRYRFIDADAFIHRRILVILETSSLPYHFYTVISYVWFGLLASPSQLARDGSFRVSCGFRSDGTPREDGGPISLKILQYACQWASSSHSPYLWLDRLCILQTSRQDKAWQISRMYDIYEGSDQCLVLPGGLQRLASVFDETSWADRAWTYQEAIVTWDYAVVLTKDWHRPREEGEGFWLVDGECHWKHLMQLFIEGGDLLTRRWAVGGAEDAGVERPCLILGRNGRALDILRRIMEYKAYNDIARENESISNQTIRQLVLQGVAMRTSSRPVDMVFSILGSMGVEDTFQKHIDIGNFKEHERFRATLTLVEAVLRLEDDDSATTSSTLVDVPLWQSLEIMDTAQSPHDGSERNKLDTTMLPTLSELTQLLDNDATELPLSCRPGITMKRVQLPEWTFEIEETDDEASTRASAIAVKISDSDFLNAYHGGQDRILVHHEEEGVIELCRKLGLKPLSEDELDLEFVFGWNLKLNRHPNIRFYKFDISHVFL